MANEITKFEDNVTKWYNDIINKADLIDYGLVKGTVVLKPYAYAIWKNIQNIMTGYFDENNVEELYFPLLIPYSSLVVEKKHIEGFAPEVFTVTKIGNKEIEPLVIRPTSEILFTKYFKDNVQTYKNLPMLLNQWVGVMRGEKNTRPFLRTSEFLWQEGHTIHETKEEAFQFALHMFKVYKKFFNKNLNIFVLAGEKTENERFAGADNTFTIETILRDGRALQSGTSHYLGQTFSKSFDVKVQDKTNQMFYPYQTSWGVSTRMIGAIIMTHADNLGLVLPWDIAPYHVVIITHNPKGDTHVTDYANSIKEKLKKSFRVKIDDSDKGIGFKSSNWEIKGVPIRIEIGPKDLEANSLVFVDRLRSVKTNMTINELDVDYVNTFAKGYKKEMFGKTKANFMEKVVEVSNMDELREALENNKAARAYWNEDSEFENQLQTLIEGATVRMKEEVETSGICIHCGKSTKTQVIIAKSY